MSGMKSIARVIFAAGLAACTVAPRAAAQSGSIDFVVRATPSGGLEEPVRGFPFFLLSKSFEEITKEVDAQHPKPDMDAFIDTLGGSKELKAWMKKNHWVQLTGEDFLQKLTAADIMGIPEFYAAYIQRSAGSSALDFPKAKFKPADKTKDPAKYEKMVQDYRQSVQHYIETNPQSKDGMELELADKDASGKWQALVAKRNPEIHREILELAESTYLVARTETNLEGQGSLTGIPDGNYWLTTLDVTADVGDVRNRWDVPVAVRPGKPAQLILSNVNAVQPSRPSPE
jgi:hypothetical protein